MADSPLTASASCITCHRLKRKCTRELPTCALCKRVGRACRYPGSASPSTPTSLPRAAHARGARHDSSNGIAWSRHTSGRSTPQLPRLQLASPSGSGLNAVRALDGKERFPAAWFLDSVVCRGSKISGPAVVEWAELVPGPEAVGREVAGVVAERFFEGPQEWVPIISKIRISRLLRSGNSISGADTQALLQCMILLSDSEKLSSHATRYEALKSVIGFLERRGQYSVDFLGTYVLLALYELGHALYPEAFMSVSACVRICCILGFHDRRKATQVIPRADTWVEMEERRRIWWAVLILDRYVSIGFRFRPLAYPTIPADEILPAADTDWDHGELAVNPLLVMSMEARTIVSPFARTCQAAHILGRVLEHVNEHADASNADFHFQEAQHIARAAEALLVMLHSESDAKLLEQRHTYFLPRALCYSALQVLYDVHSCVEVDEVESVGGNRGLRLDLQQLAIDGFKGVTAKVSAFCVELTQAIEMGLLEKISPMVTHCLYSAGGTYAWYARETGDERHLESLMKLRGLLERLKGRWNVADEYLSLLVDQEFTVSGAAYQ